MRQSKTAVKRGGVWLAPNFILQPDNEAKHTASLSSRRTRSAGSDGLTPTEPWSQHHGVCARDDMKTQRDLRRPTATEDAWLVRQHVGNNLPAEFLQKACASCTEENCCCFEGNTKHWLELDFSSVHSLCISSFDKKNPKHNTLTLQHSFTPLHRAVLLLPPVTGTKTVE